MCVTSVLKIIKSLKTLSVILVSSFSTLREDRRVSEYPKFGPRWTELNFQMSKN